MLFAAADLIFPKHSELGFGALIGPAHGRLTGKKK
jgi:hypothetical protein